MEKIHFPEEGGLELTGQQAEVVMLVTTWRSGSTFLGHLLASQPGTFYHYEPLAFLSIVQVRAGDLAVEAVNTLRSLMRCNYSSLGAFIIS